MKLAPHRACCTSTISSASRRWRVCNLRASAEKAAGELNNAPIPCLLEVSGVAQLCPVICRMQNPFPAGTEFH
jgi:hypothetical protein